MSTEFVLVFYSQNSVPKATLHSRWDTELSRYGALGVSDDGEVTVAGHDGMYGHRKRKCCPGKMISRRVLCKVNNPSHHFCCKGFIPIPKG